MSPKLKAMWLRLGRWEKAFLILLPLYLFLKLVWPASGYTLAVQVLAWLSGIVAAFKLLRRWVKTALWRLRNRLIIAYMFIAVVPIGLILVLIGLTAWVVTGQVAVYIVHTALQRKITGLGGAAVGLSVTPANLLAERIRWMAPYMRYESPGLELIVKAGNRDFHFPDDSKLELPPAGWGRSEGLLVREGKLLAWAYVMGDDSQVLIVSPLDEDALSRLVPGLGKVSVVPPERLGVEFSARSFRFSGDLKGRESGQKAAPDADPHLPPAANRLDLMVMMPTLVPVAIWDQPNNRPEWTLGVMTRPSALLATVFSQKAQIGEFFRSAFLFVAGLFLVVELISLIIGTTMSRAMTRAVHNLYEGTQSVMRGDLSHRIEVSKRRDQLAELSISFNQMTENLDRLLAVEKEQQRLQSELEIAREVQNQLFPKDVPHAQGLQLHARCLPARIVSGDFFDYMALPDQRIGVSLGDVAGKGISAALLMAAAQSTMRTQLVTCLELHASTQDGRIAEDVSAATLVSRLNRQLYATTSPEKYATFYFALYDDRQGTLTYTNAGHLPPLLFRHGEPQRLDVNGMVVGAFSFATYEQTTLQLEPGDLLLCYTDGITEPENEYGEMFGEERLIEVVRRNLSRSNEELIEAITESVQEWTGAGELQDDLTMLVARKV